MSQRGRFKVWMCKKTPKDVLMCLQESRSGQRQSLFPGRGKARGVFNQNAEYNGSDSQEIQCGV